MTASLRTRILTTLAGVAVLLLASTSLALASVQSKSILTTNGLCVNSGNPPTLADGTTPCGSAVYGANGYTGYVTYSADEVGTTAQLYDFLCVHPTGGKFTSYAGTYTLMVAGTTSTYTVAGGVDCSGGANPAHTGTIATFTVPAGGVVAYSVSIAGVTSQTCQSAFAAYNSTRNQVYDLLDGSHAAAPSVPTCAPPANVPDAPFASLLLVTSGIGAALFVARKNGFSFSRGLGR